MRARMDKYEEELATKYGFVVTAEGDRFVVTDPQMPGKKKPRYIGGNLYALLLQAVDERNKLKAKVMDDSSPNTKSNVIPLKKTRQPQPGVGIGGDLSTSPLAPKPTPPQNSPQKGNKLYLIKKMLLINPKVTVEEISKALIADGFTASVSTISTVRSDFMHSMRVIKEMNRWRDC